VEVFRGIPTNAVYSAFKSAVWAFTRSLAVELGNDGGTSAAGGWFRRASGRGWTALPDSP
jgi:NAD(P)-dependent dehydrogenase (short-subunit alcohol dehydrogenase family)